MSNGDSFNKRPSLLVGVGGTGLRIAKRVSEMLRADGEGHGMKVGVLAFDTDEGDIRRAKQGTDGFPVIQVSSQESVYKLLSTLAENENLPNWPGAESIPFDLLVRKNIDGAGQVRMLSSMGFYYNMTRGEAVQNQLRQIQAQLFGPQGHPGGPNYDGKLDVMIVGSIAGGTGSGIFLQSGLVIRDWLESIGAAATVRAFLLLPNIFINGGLPTSQNDSVRANAYAALREIHAVLQTVTGLAVDDFSYFYAPDKELKVWNANQPPRDRPFHSITLMDGFALAGRPLAGGIPAYEGMAANCAYQLLFTPLGVKQNSIHDNDVRDAIAEAAENRSTPYAGMGMSGLVYPLLEVEEFLSLSFARQTLSEEWLLLDHLFRDELAEFERRQRAGDPGAREVPDRGESYVRALRGLAQEGQAFFQRLHEQVYRKVEDKQGNSSESKAHEQYLDSLEGHLMAAFWSLPEIAKLNRADFQVISPQEMDDQEIFSEIRNRERMLAKAGEALMERLNEEPRNQFVSTWIAAERSGKGEEKPYQIQTHLFGDGAHPVKTRYFLYSLHTLIEQRLDKARDDLTVNDRLLKTNAEMFDDKETPNVIETATHVAARLSEASWLKRTLGREFKSFKEQYAAYFQNVAGALQARGNIKGRIQIYERLGQEVSYLARVSEQFFDSLLHLQTDLDKHLQENAKHHEPDAPGGDTNIYLLADALAKKALWEGLSPSLMGASVTEEANLALLKGIYAAYKEVSQPRHSRFDEEPKPFDGQELFQKTVVDGYCLGQLRSRFAGNYQFNIADAIARDGVLRGKDKDRYLEELAEKAISQAHPFLDTDRDARNDIHLWTLSPSVQQALGGEAGVSARLRGGRGSVSFVVEDAFDDQSLNCFHFRLNLGVEALVKFRRGEEYEDAYRKVHDRLLREEHDRASSDEKPSVFTHHIHKDWHRPGVLPEFSREDSQRLKDTAMEAWLLGHALGLFDFRPDGGGARVYLEGRLLSTSDRPPQLLAELMQHPPFIEAIEQEGERRRSNSQGREALMGQLLAPPMLFQLLRLGQYRETQKGQENAFAFYFGLLRGLARRQRPEARETEQLQSFQNRFGEARAGLEKLGDFQSLSELDKKDLMRRLEGALQNFESAWQAEVDQQERQGRH